MVCQCNSDPTQGHSTRQGSLAPQLPLNVPTEKADVVLESQALQKDLDNTDSLEHVETQRQRKHTSCGSIKAPLFFCSSHVAGEPNKTPFALDSQLHCVLLAVEFVCKCKAKRNAQMPNAAMKDKLGMPAWMPN